MSERQLAIDLGPSGQVTAVETPAEGDPVGWRFLYAPGASANVHDPFGTFACRTLAERGVSSVRIQFPYQEAGRRSPDRNDILEATWMAASEQLATPDTRLAVGGRSMGGRIASQVLAKGVQADALVLFAYPLHPPGKPDQRRVEHLPNVTVPTLFCSGANDAFASPDELQQAAALLTSAQVHLLEGADHGFNVKKATGRTRQDVWEEAVDVMWDWLRRL
jgi:predicted alpha/beta-hydrolase family hydrolase